MELVGGPPFYGLPGSPCQPKTPSKEGLAKHHMALLPVSGSPHWPVQVLINTQFTPKPASPKALEEIRKEGVEGKIANGREQVIDL